MRSLSALLLIIGGAHAFSSERPYISSLRLLGGHRIKFELSASPFDFIFGGNDESGEKTPGVDEDPMSASFQDELLKRQRRGSSEEDERTEDRSNGNGNGNGDEFDGYQMRDAIYNKYGECFDLEFQRVDSYGFRQVYLNVLPFRLGGRRFRHETELDYLCHLQAVVEILMKYDQLDYVLLQLEETKKKPRAGTSPLVAVPLRLDLTEDQVNKILG